MTLVHPAGIHQHKTASPQDTVPVLFEEDTSQIQIA
jgi:hypothetical protein